MSPALDLGTDWHTHTDTTDGAASPWAMVQAAAAAGLHRLHVTDHVRAGSTWVPGYVTEISRVRALASVDVVCGVEAKILDVKGAVDLPADLRGVEQVVVSDHQFPTRRGPVTPSEMRRRIRAGEVLPGDVLADLVLATSRAVFVHERVVVGHLFSVLPKAGIDPALVTTEMLDMLATACRSAGAVVEVNEKWRTPHLDVVRHLCALGVDVVPSSDAHDVAALGAWDHVASAAELVTA
jgi:putative hydrolase